MALHPSFPTDPYVVLDPGIRWFPADETLREEGYDKLLPPLVAELRKAVKKWRDEKYEGASATSKALLTWWFKTEQMLPLADGTLFNFRYYFSQREAVETILYLHDVVKVKDKYDLMRFDSSGRISAGMFAESWPRYVIKMATGSGKTKVLSLLLAWSYFHRLYEEDSDLARNFLVIAPNIIVLDRLRMDFNGLKIFFSDPVLPEDGYEGRNWHEDFQMTLHIQDEVHVTQHTGNIFLTNIHRIYQGEGQNPSPDDEDARNYYLGPKPVTQTTDSKVSVGDIVRDIDELMVLNDEAHHIHDERMAWFKSIEDIHNNLKMKGKTLSLQIDVTATPKHDKGSIFVQTVSDYPLVEAIHQNVVKHPIAPDAPSRAKLHERQSSIYSERYADYLNLGYLEWQKAAKEHEKMGKKAVLFIMTDDTKNCDEVAKYMENHYPDLAGSILVIHTKNNGEISESNTGKAKEELEKLREDANKIDHPDNPFRAIVSVLMLKEGWDVRNVTTIVGLRAYTSPANILPEQTLGRGLRRMYSGEDVKEEVSVVGTDAFMDFVELIKNEGVELERGAMGEGSRPKTPIIVEVDKENLKKDIAALDIQIPELSARIYREYKNLADLAPSSFSFQKLSLKQFSDEEKRQIIFKDITTEDVSHMTELDTAVSPSGSSAIGFFARAIKNDLHLVGGYDILYGKVKEFVQEHLYGAHVDLDDLNLLRNLSEIEATRTINETFKKQINALTVKDKGDAEIRNYIKLSHVRPFVAKEQAFLVPKKSPFNKIIGDSHFELEFAAFLESCEDVISYGKNYFAVNFRIDYQNADGDISNYYPDFLVKTMEHEVYIVETKGREDLDDPRKIDRLKQWCVDANALQKNVRYGWLYVKQEEYEKRRPHSFQELIRGFQ
ncbi:MAG: DEAD/DEAH box helicase family protein [Patescibacteria group bacterium]